MSHQRVKKYYLFVFVLVFIVFSTHSLSAEPINVFILAGQSNMSGNAAVNGLPSEYSGKFENVLIHLDPKTDGLANRKGSWMTLEPGFGWGNGNANQFGPELLFGITLSKEYPDQKFALIKSSVAGQDLAVQFLSPSSGNAGKLYNGLVSEIDNALSSLDDQYEPQIMGMLWMQGEADAMNQGWANAYEKNLENFIKDIRAEVEVEDMPFIAANIDEQGMWWTHYRIVNGAMNNLADKMENVFTFPTKGFDTDGIHYKTQGMIELGKAYAEVIIENKFIEPKVAVAPTVRSVGNITKSYSVSNNSIMQFDLSGRKITPASISAPAHLNGTPMMILKNATSKSGKRHVSKVIEMGR